MASGCWRPWSAAPRHRSTTERRSQPIRPSEPDLEEVLQDARVRGGRLGAGCHGQSAGDMEGRVRGGYPSPFFTASSSSHSHLPMPLRSREEALSMQRELYDIERSMVIPICLNAEARGFFPDSRRLLDTYLAAAKRLLQMEMFGDMERRKKALLDMAMSSLAMEFIHLRVWRLGDAMRDHSPASIWKTVRRSCSPSSEDSAASWPSSSSSFTGTCGASDSSYGEPSVQCYNIFSGMIYTDSKSLSILNDIADVMIGGGYEHILRGAFDRHCAQLARYIEILDIDNILGGHVEEPRKILVKVWTSAMHIIIGFLSEMQRQLNLQDFGSFDTLKEDYFLAIAKVSVMKLLNSASSICVQVGPPIHPSCNDNYAIVKSDLTKIVNVVMTYQALDYAMPNILPLFSGETKEFIVAEGEDINNRLSHMFVKLSVELNNLVKSQCLSIINTGVHRVTKDIMHHTRLLVQQRNIIHLIQNGDFKAFDELVARMISSLKFMLDMNSRTLQFKGQQQIFLLNNMHFLLKEAEKHTDLGLTLGESWFSQCHDQIDQCIAGYVDASWTPVMSSFKRRTRLLANFWPHQLFHEFTSSFEMTCSMQKTWKVSDPFIRQRLRKAISHKIIPLYQIHMEYYSEKTHKSARYNIEKIELRLQGLFEG